ncbi:MAG: calmodulin [Gammaproteobacteria bacterium]|nr:calmodulin [Gammaproteobacteria bacterium]
MTFKLTLATVALLTTGAAFAESSLYNDLDADQNGAISQKEAAALPGLTEKWEELDANADGVIDQAEFAKLEVMEEPAAPAE